MLVAGLTSLGSAEMLCAVRNAPGGVIEIEQAVDISNVMLVCPHCKERTRVTFEVLTDGRKVRKCKKCANQIEVL